MFHVSNGEWEPVRLYLRGGPLDGHIIDSFRINGELSKFRACVLNSQTIAVYRRTDDLRDDYRVFEFAQWLSRDN
jgi:hypothetical protein